jgi:hypothetical protein
MTGGRLFKQSIVTLARYRKSAEKNKIAAWKSNLALNQTTPIPIQIEYLLAYSPELQPAERLWTLVDEPLLHECFETIDDIEAALVSRCNVLCQMTTEIKKLTYYHWLSFL